LGALFDNPTAPGPSGPFGGVVHPTRNEFRC